MNRADLTAIEKRIAAAEVVHHQRRNAFVVLHRRDGLTSAELSCWQAENAAAMASADMVVVIRGIVCE